MERPDIFVSYSREDIRVAAKFADGLSKAGFSVWWDQSIKSGETYDEVTENALRAARAVLVLWSKASVKSRWVRSEATVAVRNDALIPVMIEPCDRPVMFELHQARDLTGWPSAAKAAAWQDLLADLRHKVSQDDDAASPAPDMAVPRPKADLLKRRWRPALAVFALILAALVGFSVMTPKAYSYPNRTAVFEFSASGNDPETVEIADATRQDLFVQMGASGIETIARSQTDGVPANQQSSRAKDLNAQYSVGGRLTRADSKLVFNVSLEDVPAGKNLWETTVSVDASERETLVARVSDQISEVVKCFSTNRPYLELAVPNAFETLRGYCVFDARSEPYDGFLKRARALSDVSVDGAPIHYVLAMNLEGQLLFDSEAESKKIYREISKLAERSKKTKGGIARAASLEAMLANYDQKPLNEQIALTELGARDPNGSIAKMDHALLLAQVGRIGEAVEMARKASAINPGNSTFHLLYARLVAIDGRRSESGTIANAALKRFGTDLIWQLAMFNAVMFGGGDSSSLAREQPPSTSDEAKACIIKLAERMKLDEQSIIECNSAVATNFYDVPYYFVQKNSESIYSILDKQVGRRNSKFFWLEIIYADEARFLRDDPKIIPFVTKLGFVEYWKSAKVLPDICLKPSDRDSYFCRELRRLTGLQD